MDNNRSDLKNWTVHAKKADFDSISSQLGIDPVIARIMINRGIPVDKMASFLRPTRTDFNDPLLMKDMKESVAIIKDAVSAKKRFRIIGDYDIDGICATFILKRTMEMLGADVDYYLPKRIEDGYGMNEDMAMSAVSDRVDVIITCDNGIAADSAVAIAKEHGITVIVTDHHEVLKSADGKDVLPCADSVIDPKRSDCEYPFKEICGAVVAWKLAICLLDEITGSSEAAMDYIEFAALATIGDIMVLKDENRAIVSMGLRKMSHSKNLGLRMLIECCGLNGKKLSSYHVGFILGPCLNAGGRLSDASLGVQLFETTDMDEARSIAERLLSLNEERKQMTSDGTADAVSHIEENGYDKNKVIVAYVPGVHESLCGIIAGRLKERYSRPCFMLSDGESYVKGSGRSISSYSMFEKLSECSDMFLMFGGHPMAAGLSIEKDRIEDFRLFINNHCELKEDDLVEKVMIDVPMPLGYITAELIRQLDELEPFGNGNEKPVFAEKEVCIWKIQRIGKNSEFLKLLLKSRDDLMEALYFGDADDFLENVSQGDNIDIIYYPQINVFRGEETLQVVIKDFRVKGN